MHRLISSNHKNAQTGKFNSCNPDQQKGFKIQLPFYEWGSVDKRSKNKLNEKNPDFVPVEISFDGRTTECRQVTSVFEYFFVSDQS